MAVAVRRLAWGGGSDCLALGGLTSCLTEIVTVLPLGRCDYAVDKLNLTDRRGRGEESDCEIGGEGCGSWMEVTL